MVDDHRRWAAFAPDHPDGSRTGPKWGAHDLIHHRSIGGLQRTSWRINKLPPEALAHCTSRAKRRRSARRSKKVQRTSESWLEAVTRTGTKAAKRGPSRGPGDLKAEGVDRLLFLHTSG